MTLVPAEKEFPCTDDWPAKVDLILSAIDAGRGNLVERRKRYRLPYRAIGKLRLFSDTDDAEPWTLYSHDVDSRGVGFITPRRLPLGYGGMIDIRAPNGEMVRAHCTVFRCRETVQGWYEAALYFNTEQYAFHPGERTIRLRPP